MTKEDEYDLTFEFQSKTQCDGLCRTTEKFIYRTLQQNSSHINIFHILRHLITLK